MLSRQDFYGANKCFAITKCNQMLSDGLKFTTPSLYKSCCHTGLEYAQCRRPTASPKYFSRTQRFERGKFTTEHILETQASSFLHLIHLISGKLGHMGRRNLLQSSGFWRVQRTQLWWDNHTDSFSLQPPLFVNSNEGGGYWETTRGGITKKLFFF